MNIYAPKGTKVYGLFDQNGKAINGYDSDKLHIETLLVPFKAYTVERTEVSQSSTRVWLQEFPQTSFNSVSLTEAIEEKFDPFLVCGPDIEGKRKRSRDKLRKGIQAKINSDPILDAIHSDTEEKEREIWRDSFAIGFAKWIDKGPYFLHGLTTWKSVDVREPIITDNELIDLYKETLKT